MYKVHITITAEHDLEAAVRYITNNIHNKAAAKRLLDSFDKINSNLEKTPTAFPYVKDELVAAAGFKWTKLGNYMAIFTIDEFKNSVYIVRVLYKRRKWQELI